MHFIKTLMARHVHKCYILQLVFYALDDDNLLHSNQIKCCLLVLVKKILWMPYKWRRSSGLSWPSVMLIQPAYIWGVFVTAVICYNFLEASVVWSAKTGSALHISGFCMRPYASAPGQLFFYKKLAQFTGANKKIAMFKSRSMYSIIIGTELSRLTARISP